MTMRHLSEMVRNREPLVLGQHAKVADACRRMRDRGVGAVLVADGAHRLRGIFTGRDAVCRVLAEGRHPGATELAEVMTPEPCTIPPAATAIEALRLMSDGGFRHLPVVEDGRIVGVVSVHDFRGLEQARLDEENVIWERL
ncbi:histidine kinase [Allostella vacuolata]|nr:histidine kinase [Stella vacuolata]